MSYQLSVTHLCFLLSCLLCLSPVSNIDAQTHTQPFFQTAYLLLVLPVGKALSLSVSTLTAEQQYYFKVAQLLDIAQVSY